MLSFLPAMVKGCIAAGILALNTVLMCLPLLLVALLKLIVPIDAWRRFCTRVLVHIAELWMDVNSGWMRLTQRMHWDVRGVENLRRDQWYLVVCNHQSWADIHILQHLLNRRIPMMKFFLKRELIWVPVIGLGWWALDFPFMQRYSREYLDKHPQKRGKDLETTRKACEKFKQSPVAVFNFLEGTRFTPDKHQDQQSPFENLLLPRTGGVGFVLGAMGDRLETILDITVYYPDRDHLSYWDFLSGQIQEVVVRIEQQPIPDVLRGRDYTNDAAFRKGSQQWITELWQRKDTLLTKLQGDHSC
jgi:1-acyl-sn-glycerol-3-phosphate acyltransferase